MFFTTIFLMVVVNILPPVHRAVWPKEFSKRQDVYRHPPQVAANRSAYCFHSKQTQSPQIRTSVISLFGGSSFWAGGVMSGEPLSVVYIGNPTINKPHLYKPEISYVIMIKSPLWHPACMHAKASAYFFPTKPTRPLVWVKPKKTFSFYFFLADFWDDRRHASWRCISQMTTASFTIPL